MSWRSRINRKIFVYGKEWRFAVLSDIEDGVKTSDIEVRIESDGNNGYHLCLMLEGCNTYDTWYESLDDAFDAAFIEFSVLRNAWIEEAG